jgi:predicted acylesterase/phospholipase RssA
MHHVTHVPLAGAFGGGGLFGIGYAMGVLDGLREQGINLSTAPMVGTSAGSWAAAATALGVGFDQLAALDNSLTVDAETASRPRGTQAGPHAVIIPDGWLDAEATAPPDALADASVSGG